MSTRKLRVGLIFGGRSGEHEVSLRSAQSVMAALDPVKYEVTLVGIDRGGHWQVGPRAGQLLGAAAGQPAAPTGGPLVPQEESLSALDVIFPVLHGPYGEDGTVQGLLELAGIPYVGCGVLASALAMDKAASKVAFAGAGLPQVPYLVVKRKQVQSDPGLVLDEIERELRYPMFVKPANLGSSVGVGKAKDRAGLELALTEACRYDRKLVVEQGIDAREIEVSVLGNDEPVASVPGEIVPGGEFYDYAAKYLDASSRLLIPAPISPELAAEAQRLAVQAFLTIDGAGMARVDFLLDRSTGQLYLNEVNTIPGFTSISMYPKLWEASGLGYSDLMDRLIELALERHADRSRSLSTYEPPGADHGQA